MEVSSVILTIAVIASSGSISAHPFNEISLKTITNEGNEMKNQEIFHNLFESISKNDVKNTGTYRSILEVQAAREQHAFNLLKENVEFARQKNADRQKHFDINNGNTHEKLAVKREIPGSDAGSTCAAPREKTAEEIEIESVAQQIQNEITNMTDSYDRSTGENIHTMWYNKILEIEKSLRTNTAPVLTNEAEDSQVEFFAQRVRRKIDNWPDVEHPVGFKIHHMWYEKARDIEKRLKKKYPRIPKQ